MPQDMVLIPGGEFAMGSRSYYPEEGPVHTARVDAFLIDAHPVTNRLFREFVDATGYVTVAERALDATEYPQLNEAERAPGSLAFRKTAGPVDLRDWRAWWEWMPGANWRHPFGPDDDIDGKDEHPVVQVCFTDAAAYAAWAGKRLPTEVEWERAARGGLDGAEFAWGDELAPDGELRANTWQGSFPYDNTGANGWVGTSPVGSFASNGYGLVDMIGNVWEWTSSRFTANHREAARAAALEAPAGRSLLQTVPVTAADDAGAGCGCGCGGESSRAAAGGAAASVPDSSVRRVTKGGSHLCAPEYCQRYRPAARSPQTEDSATTHLGFRCAADA
ncbi:Formylglycine-generating enzyme, required for sulfatase activity, contains SUMF1/FGE domain [Paramicrobacterium humi]|uniref:Formylglycine-generating enzyme, required for sulfatase activity, contains SUMF1/FGE domain n=1 Tax=Paramicrobacterium humi TaxID=640635 RepID=A0A1H4L6V8_9MICO|nr:formylglycine-generating enzyme family protein [Microbacterium humi]SEB66489.1 Formylglycine-generating enzyme, required for sulfatase activity, contains SUMF1/FGE domain [Microbacterium humi]